MYVHTNAFLKLSVFVVIVKASLYSCPHYRFAADSTVHTQTFNKGWSWTLWHKLNSMHLLQTHVPAIFSFIVLLFCFHATVPSHPYPSSMPTSHFTMAKSSLTFTPNLQTNINTYYIRQLCYPMHTKRAIPFSLAPRLRRICSTNEIFTLRTNGLIDYLYKLGYNRYFLQRKYSELTTSHGQKHSRPMTLQYWTNQNVFPFVTTYNPALRSISSIIRKQFHILISFPRCYNVFKAEPIVTYRRSSNLSDFLVRANFAISHNSTSPRDHTHAEKTASLVNTHLTGKHHTYSTLQAKPHLSLITLTVTLKSSFSWYNATTALNNT